MEFNVKHIVPIDWDDEAFTNLVLPQARKNLLRSLIEGNAKAIEANPDDDIEPFDDFIRGKGQGLVISLFGPPGVGKTLSAEAISEHLRRPLYIIGSGKLGTNAEDLNRKLERACEIASRWKAVLLIDEVSAESR